MSTFMAKKETVQRRWYVIDATDCVVGRLAVVIANILRGKTRPDYTPHCDVGDFVIVLNAEKVRFTGKKWEQVVYRHYTHYAGGLREETAENLRDRRPEEIIRRAVQRMVPRNRLGRKQMTKLKIFQGTSHPHQAQMPVELDVSHLKAKD